MDTPEYVIVSIYPLLTSQAGFSRIFFVNQETKALGNKFHYKIVKEVLDECTTRHGPAELFTLCVRYPWHGSKIQHCAKHIRSCSEIIKNQTKKQILERIKRDHEKESDSSEHCTIPSVDSDSSSDEAEDTLSRTKNVENFDQEDRKLPELVNDTKPMTDIVRKSVSFNASQGL
ncbi:MAG: hypothetical protein EOP45_11000 [Sphingobacteriaceae bacterium]|nr:MAG: hypothetical protein EOP45_11000 [Sphingobacteriaceae bacterium]